MRNFNAICIHVPCGEVPSGGNGWWSMTRFAPGASDSILMDEVELWDGISQESVRIPNGEVILFFAEMMKKYG